MMPVLEIPARRLHRHSIFLAATSLTFSITCSLPPTPQSFSEPKYVSSADGAPICFEASGLGKPALVFVHGWSCDRSYCQNMFTPETDSDLMEAIIADMCEAPPEVAVGSIEALITYDTPASLRRLDLPIRCINSTRYATKIEIARQFIPRFDVAPISGVGHFPMVEKPREFNHLLAEAVNDLVSEKRPLGL